MSVINLKYVQKIATAAIEKGGKGSVSISKAAPYTYNNHSVAPNIFPPKSISSLPPGCLISQRENRQIPTLTHPSLFFFFFFLKKK